MIRRAHGPTDARVCPQAGALAALEDQAYLDSVRGQVLQAREELNDIATSHGLTPLPTATNFVTMDCGRDVRPSTCRHERLSRPARATPCPPRAQRLQCA